ncbi:valine--tRNA ligase [Archaeoglobus veneficus]|uniref:Valine--tRNA ligase n=1 Tax=Archaeoglobus veneficus (strain DSM 11195 / SNP6) TaxID=693661 RepID=F2KRJ9_ARCVS|nr:valine--tRNA ligase [Archaeoglobus veneficus]AEA46764.1 Valyl-tRNA synthetase [Archaeoglobus veneficus SNP6]
MEIEKEYRAKEVEEKWVRQWKDEMYYFDWNSEKPHYIIDTPPPYPTGSFHIGNTLNWCYIDFIARYKRMKGYEVMFPQGWDCHGLPTEVKVEEMHGISKNDVPREEFRRLCVEFTEKNIEKMRSAMRRLGFSIDWSKEYITMYPEYYTKTQVSFVRMYNQGLIYKGYHPVIFCPRCETTIALAEIEYKSGTTKLNYIRFGDGEDSVVIATTRPELIPACVAIAVHPDDERYRHLIGKKVRVPVGGHEVEVIADEDVDMEYGTGIVMICTFGDRQDVKWWKKHNLELRMVLDRTGRLNEKAGKYAGLTTKEAREKIIEDLKAEGRLIKQEDVEQNVGVCWRCKTPVEIIAEEQWFVKIDKERILKEARKIKWFPEHMLSRLEGWVEGMEWDWVISRQRIFATPIPVWYCKNCGAIVVAKEEWLPVDPTKDAPKEPCPQCGSTEFEGEDDVLDTWMDSSITPLAITGWPYDWKEYPTHLRPQGHDIIRTWAFYTILRSLALANKIPWYEIVINGMVLGEDGRKMSKSLGNIISPEEVLEKYGADALRQWAATGVVGSDVIFTWKEVIAASRFQQKFWSILRFTMSHIKDYTPSEDDEKLLRIADRWILSKLNRLIKDVDEHMENYRFNEALKAIRSFTWYEYADNYLEIVKNRLYSGSDEEKRAAKFVLYNAMDALIRLLAPITPFIAEECWNIFKGNGSVHLQSYPQADKAFIDSEAEKRGDLMRDIVAEVRRLKHDRGMALNAPLKFIKIYSPIEVDARDIGGALNAKVEILSEAPEISVRIKALKPKYGILGPMFRDKVKKIVEAVNALNEEDKDRLLKEGLEIDIDGEVIKLERDWFEAEIEKVVSGKEVDVLEVGGAVVVVEI